MSDRTPSAAKLGGAEGAHPTSGNENPDAPKDSYLSIWFQGDSIGYRLDAFQPVPPTSDPCWVHAFVGQTAKRVWIDVSKAYIIERVEYQKVAS